MRSKRVKKTAQWAVFSVSGGALQRGAVVSRSETESRRPLHNSQRCSRGSAAVFIWVPSTATGLEPNSPAWHRKWRRWLQERLPLSYPRMGGASFRDRPHNAECAFPSSQHPSIVAAPFRKRFRPISQASTKRNRNAWGKQSSRLPLQKGRWFLCTTSVRRHS